MDDKQREIVQRVAAEVVKVLRDREMVAPGSATGSVAPPAQISPPIGTCTAGDSTPQPTTSVVPLTGIVTARQLQEAMDAADDGVAVLATDARLSPLANDLARQHKELIRRASACDVGAPRSGAQASADSPWLYWIMGRCSVAERIIVERPGRLSKMNASPTPDALPQVLRDLAGAVKGRSAPGGVLFVSSAARVACYANRCPSIRAVVGTCSKAVEQGVDDLGANVLVIEYAHHGPESMGAMVDRMIQQVPNVPPQVQRDLGDLQRCG